MGTARETEHDPAKLDPTGATVRELPGIDMAPGCHQRLFIDRSIAEGEPGYNWSDTSYDGKPGSLVLSVGSHWHEKQDEYLTVMAGRVKIWLDGKTMVVSAGEPTLEIPRLSVHGFSMIEGQPATLRETSAPSGDFKEEFFREMFQEGYPDFLGAMKTFRNNDVFPSLGWKPLDRAFIAAFGELGRMWKPKAQPLPPR